MNLAPPVLALVLSSALAAQSVILVPDQAPTIQAGIDLAADGDTVLVAPGIYVETIDFSGKAIAVVGQGGAAATVIDAGGAGQPTVAFHAGEGPDSILHGFTVTGSRNAGSSIPGAGISCQDFAFAASASPTIRECLIEGNQNLANGNGGGVGGGAPQLVDCVVRGNLAVDGAGVWGAASLLRCEVRENSGRDGGGLYLVSGTTATIEDCLVTGNIVQEGTRGAGAYVGMPGVVFRRTSLVDNTSIGFGGMVQVQGAAVHAAAGAEPTFERCTIAGNRVEQGSLFGPDVGGLFGVVHLVDSIVWGNDEIAIDAAGSSARFSDVQGGWPGVGNLDADPLFVDATAGDHELFALSPCIDAGDPASELDPDCTRADMGARAFAQANVVLRNGGSTNRVGFLSLTRPVVGQVWQVRVLSSDHPGATLSGLQLRAAAAPVPVTIPAGEILIDLSSPLLFRALRPASGAADDFGLPVPADPALIGFGAFAQGFVLGGGAELLNALDLKFGH